MTVAARSARAAARAFASYRRNMAVALDPDERCPVRNAAWARAANARARIERHLSLIEVGGMS